MNGLFRPYDREVVLAELSGKSRSALGRLELPGTVDSTNLEVLRLPDDQQHGSAIIADCQSAGRGRRGRKWHSPAGCNIYLSLGWNFADPTSSLGHLPLAVAVMLTRALARGGLESAGIKWPNDILADGRKLAGVLIELHPCGGEKTLAVIGTGINVRMPPGEANRADIGQAWTDVSSQLPAPAPPDFRDRLAGMVLDELVQGIMVFAASGFEFFAADWAKRDALSGKEVTVSGTSESLEGQADGIGESGGLLVRLREPSGALRVQEFFAGEVSVRQPEN